MLRSNCEWHFILNNKNNMELRLVPKKRRLVPKKKDPNIWSWDWFQAYTNRSIIHWNFPYLFQTKWNQIQTPIDRSLCMIDTVGKTVFATTILQICYIIARLQYASIPQITAITRIYFIRNEHHNNLLIHPLILFQTASLLKRTSPKSLTN